MSAHAAKRIDRRIIEEPKVRKRIQNYNWTDESLDYALTRMVTGASASTVAKEMEKRWPQFGKPTRNAVIGKVNRALEKRNQKKIGPRFTVISGEPRPVSQRIQKINRATANEMRSAPTPVNLEALPLSDIQSLPDPTYDAVRRLGPLPDLNGLPISILSLRPGMCKYPIGDPAKPGFAFCGRSIDCPPYCSAHRLLVYDPREDKRRDAELKKIGRFLPSNLRS